MRTSIASVLVAALGAAPAAAETIPAPDTKVAFIADQGDGDDAIAVLELIAAEGAHAVVHAGDFDYEDDPEAWDHMLTGALGQCFPYFACAGNHDEDEYFGSGGYQDVLEARMQCAGIPWDGDLGFTSSHSFRGIFFVLTSPDIFDSNDGDAVHAPYIREQLAADQSAWRISSWHKLMEAMQVGDKSDESGWGVYEESRLGGAIIATGHEHSYARSHMLSSCVNQTPAREGGGAMRLRRDDPETPKDEGRTFVFHNGLGGHSIRDQTRCLPTGPPYGCNGEWAKVYAEQQGAQHGALFGVFGVNGDPCRARFYFKDIDGNVADQFTVRSTVGPCAPCYADLDGDQAIGFTDLERLLDAWGACQGEACAEDLNGSGHVSTGDLLFLFYAWGTCGKGR